MNSHKSIAVPEDGEGDFKQTLLIVLAVHLAVIAGVWGIGLWKKKPAEIVWLDTDGLGGLQGAPAALAGPASGSPAREGPSATPELPVPAPSLAKTEEAKLPPLPDEPPKPAPKPEKTPDLDLPKKETPPPPPPLPKPAPAPVKSTEPEMPEKKSTPAPAPKVQPKPPEPKPEAKPKSKTEPEPKKSTPPPKPKSTPEPAKVAKPAEPKPAAKTSVTKSPTPEPAKVASAKIPPWDKPVEKSSEKSAEKSEKPAEKSAEKGSAAATSPAPKVTREGASGAGDVDNHAKSGAGKAESGKGVNHEALREGYGNTVGARFKATGEPRKPTSVPGDNREFSALMRFKIAGDGAVLSVVVVNPSGNTIVDNWIRDFIPEFRHVPAPPPELLKDGVYEDTIQLLYEL